MIERLLENWLDKATEKSFQTPFCYMLVNEGYTVIHLTRHCAMEIGKDIIAIAPDGKPCAYQLKSSSSRKIVMDDIDIRQLDRLRLAIAHPATSKAQAHTSYFVTNKDIEEEAQRVINDYNLTNKAIANSEIQVISRGNLLKKARDVGYSLFPTELEDTKALLELFLVEGWRPLQREKFARLIENTIGIDADKISSQERLRRVSSAALITAIALSPHSSASNHISEIEGWSIFLSYLYAVAEKHNIKIGKFQNEIDITFAAICNCLYDLHSEVIEKTSKHIAGLVGTNAMVDSAFGYYRARITITAAYLAVFNFIMSSRQDIDDNDKKIIALNCEFIKKGIPYFVFLSEGFTPYLLAIYFNYLLYDETHFDYALISWIYKHLIISSKIGNGLLSPYISYERVLEQKTGISNDEIAGDICKFRSHVIEGIMYLHMKHNMKNDAKYFWSHYAKFESVEYTPKNMYDLFRWNNGESGTTSSKIPSFPGSWNEYYTNAKLSCDEHIPKSIMPAPIHLLLVLLVMPHRLSSMNMRWLDTYIRRIRSYQ